MFFHEDFDVRLDRKFKVILMIDFRTFIRDEVRFSIDLQTKEVALRDAVRNECQIIKD